MSIPFTKLFPKTGVDVVDWFITPSLFIVLEVVSEENILKPEFTELAS